MYSHPLSWAMGTKFDPYFDDLNQIAMKLDVSYKQDQENYEYFIQWIKENVPSECKTLTSKDAEQLWQNLSGSESFPISISSDIYLLEIEWPIPWMLKMMKETVVKMRAGQLLEGNA